MKVMWRTAAGIGLFLIPFAILYWFLSYEAAGTAMLVGIPLSMLGLAAYLLSQVRGRPPLPEDRADGELVEEDEVGVFPTASIWPAVLGGGMTLTALGFAYSPWLALPGLGVLFFALGGMVLESSRVR